MKVPSKRYTLKYFKSLGYTVEHEQPEGTWDSWALHGQDLPLDGRKFATRLLLWAEWMAFAAERIHEDTMGSAISRIWDAADDEQRKELKKEIVEWQRGMPSPRIKALLRRSTRGSTDRLPRNWKAQLRRILAKGSTYNPLWLQLSHMTDGSHPSSS